MGAALRLVDVPPGGVQLRLPHLRFDAGRGCDRIRRRVYADPRIRPMVAVVLLALSEFVDVRRKAWPLQELVAKMVHTDRRRVSRLSSEAESLGVLEKDRSRPGGRLCYTFAESWVGFFEDAEPRKTRIAREATPELPERQLSTEPSTGTKYHEDMPAMDQPSMHGSEIARDPAPAFDPGSAFDFEGVFDADEGGDWWRDGRRACDTSPNTTED